MSWLMSYKNQREFDKRNYYYEWGSPQAPLTFACLIKKKSAKRNKTPPASLKKLRIKGSKHSFLRPFEAQTGVFSNRLLFLFFCSPTEVSHIL